MFYSNNSINAILAMERDRTGTYGEDIYCEDDMAVLDNAYDEDDEYHARSRGMFFDEDDIADMKYDEWRCGW